MIQENLFRIVVLIAGLILIVSAIEFMAGNAISIDACLDAGGHWNYQNNICEK